MNELHAMRTFANVVDNGSFANASRAMDVAPAVVTRLVADLEHHLGARLLTRTTRRLALTDIGTQYLERVRVILQTVDEARALARQAQAEETFMNDPDVRRMLDSGAKVVPDSIRPLDDA